ncbi:TetR/AcrR family transcriptional regulator [Salipiger bermudensis]|uniref:TetR/AcrR family transcriptional regulator n=1 Tax=Salipiger bermudensis TaxID=344736 RepID=UPI001C9A2692|nr:TetR/AcrR family transcriptional regulator [Salipiger bermudensis]MBY6002711.1 TetR/AcrR family transcriptional regulator [Salipiger bermudensis]
MAGLRERQKAKRNRAILEAASTLFKQNGYEAARIEAIAESAEVSVGTLYNYYAHKADLLLAIVSMEVEEVLHQGESVVTAPPGSAREAICALIATYYDHSLVYLTKEMWRTAMAFSIQSADTKFSRRYHALDQALSEQVVALMQRLQGDGLIDEAADARALGEVIFLALNGLFTLYTVSEDMSLDALKAAMFHKVAALTELVAVPELPEEAVR